MNQPFDKEKYRVQLLIRAKEQARTSMGLIKMANYADEAIEKVLELNYREGYTSGSQATIAALGLTTDAPPKVDV